MSKKRSRDIYLTGVEWAKAGDEPKVRLPWVFGVLLIIAAVAFLVAVGMAINNPHFWGASGKAEERIPTPVEAWLMFGAIVQFYVTILLFWSYEWGYKKALRQKTHDRD